MLARTWLPHCSMYDRTHAHMHINDDNRTLTIKSSLPMNEPSQQRRNRYYYTSEQSQADPAGRRKQGSQAASRVTLISSPHTRIHDSHFPGCSSHSRLCSTPGTNMPLSPYKALLWLDILRQMLQVFSWRFSIPTAHGV